MVTTSVFIPKLINHKSESTRNQFFSSIFEMLVFKMFYGNHAQIHVVALLVGPSRYTNVFDESKINRIR